MIQNLNIKLSHDQYCALHEYVEPFYWQMKEMDPNSWDTNVFVMAGIYQTMALKTNLFGMLADRRPKHLKLANFEWFVLAHNLVLSCPIGSLHELLVVLDKLMLNKWNYSLDKFMKKFSKESELKMSIDYYLSNINSSK